MAELQGDPTDPVATAQALARVVADRRRRGIEPLTFGMTFPFSTHNYQLRFWMAAGGVDPDEDVRLVVLPPPYMVDSIAGGQIDAFCVGAPWNSIAVDRGVGYILHMVSEILIRAAEKVLSFREVWANDNPETVMRLVRAHQRAADFIADSGNRDEVLSILSQPEYLGVDPEVINRTLSGRMKISPAGEVRENKRHLLIGTDGAARPDPIQGAWLYAQMVRWGQAPLKQELLDQAMHVFRPDLFDMALGPHATLGQSGAPVLGGPDFDPHRIDRYLSGFEISRHTS
jgi:NitT/TauT family transport system ATP-binding protein